MKFSELNLEPRLMSAVEKLGYQDCTPIQETVIPLICEGKDISGLAQTGTGKTAAFLLPLMDRILKGAFTDWRAPNFILILVPTRELAEQVYENVQKLGEPCNLKGIAVYGGTSYEKQKEAFRQNVEFVVATPGRLIDLYKEHFLDLKQVRAVVFDEADRMFDMGFKDDMKYILQRIPRERQFLVFSATLNFDVLNTAYEFGADPIEVNVSKDQARAENVKDAIFHVGHDEKPSYLLTILKKHNPRQAIIFSNFKVNVEKIASFLSQNGIPAMGISSLLTQAQRNRVIELFKAENEKNILVATDVAARGLDIKGVDMVINYELPNDAESYVHRIGRTGRAGAEGQAFSLVCDRDVDSLARVEEYLKHKLDSGWMEDTDIVKDYSPFPRGELTPGRSFEPGGDRPAPPHRKGGGRQDGPRGRGGREGGRDGARDGRRDQRGGQHAGGAGAGGPRPQRPRRPEGRPESANGEHGATGAAGGEGRRDQPPRRDHNRDQNRDQNRNRNQASGDRRPNATSANGKAPAHARGPHPRNSNGAGGGHTNRKPNTSRPDHRNDNRPKAAARPGGGGKQKTTVQKVTGFFKKIFGSDTPPPKNRGGGKT